MATTENQLNQRIIEIKDETKMQLEKIAENVYKPDVRNKKQDVLEEIKERANELSVIDKTADSLVAYANQVLDNFKKEISNVPDKDKYINKLSDLLKEECARLVNLAKDKAIKRFKA
jgi:hypothetical protein